MNPIYNPARFRSQNDAEIAEIVEAFPFATLITGEHVSHLPLLLEQRGEEWFLIGHCARANQHWRALEAGPSLAIFHGPHAYITPLWYEQCDVPTWNYVVAHLSGAARLLEGYATTVAALRKLSAKMEGPKGWRFEIPEDLSATGVLAKSIAAFEIRVERRDAKLKLSQNRSPADFEGTMRGLSERSDEGSRLVLEWMQRLSKA